MWEEVALRYQQILHREYRMLNLPSYPVEGGNVYLYYVPVIVNQGPTAQTDSGVNIECNNKTTADHETSENNEDVIYINDSDEDCGVKVEPPAEFVQTVHESSYGKHIKVEDNNNLFPISCKWEKNQHDDYGSSSSKLEENTIKVGEGFDYSNSYIEHEQHTKNSSDKRDGSKMSDDEENMLDQTHCNDNNIQIREDYIRIFKGYTIEYHPLRRDNAVKQRHRAPGSQQCRKRDEKIQDLKKRLAEHKVELEKLKFQQSVEGNVSINGYANRISQQQITDKYFDGEVSECCKENNKSSFIGQRARSLLKDCPSAQIHYFPSGERKTILPGRRNSRKQTSPRRIDARLNIKTEKGANDVKTAKTEKTINGEVNTSEVKRKRKLTPSPEMMSEKLSEDKKTKRVQCSKKTNVRRKRKKAQPKSQTSRPNLQKGPQSCYNTSQVELSYVANSGKATRPQDISQEEFLSMFGLMKVKQGGTSQL